MKRFNVAFASLLLLAAPCAAERLAKDLHAGSSDHKRHPGGAGMIQLAGVPDGATVDLEFTTELDRAPWQDVVVFGRGNQVFLLVNGDGAHFGSPIGPELLRAPTHESIRPLRDVSIGIGGTATEGRLYHSLGITLAWTGSAVKIDDQLHFVHEYSTAPSLGPNDRAIVASQVDNARCWWNGTGWVNMLTSAACTF